MGTPSQVKRRAVPGEIFGVMNARTVLPASDQLTPNSSRRSCAIGIAAASAIKRFLTRRCSRGSSGIDHLAHMDSQMR